MRRPDMPDLSALVAPLAWAGLIGVAGLFLWSGVEGKRGLAALADAEARAERLEEKLAGLRAERRTAENRVRRLSRDYLDLELLDERARAVLGLARPDELVVPPVHR